MGPEQSPDLRAVSPTLSVLTPVIAERIERCQAHLSSEHGGQRCIETVVAMLARDSTFHADQPKTAPVLFDLGHYAEDPRFAGMKLGQIMAATREEREREAAAQRGESQRIALRVLDDALTQSPADAVKFLKAWERQFAQAWRQERSAEGIRSTLASLLPSQQPIEPFNGAALRHAFLNWVPGYARVSELVLDRAIDIAHQAHQRIVELSEEPEQSIRDNIQSLRTTALRSSQDDSARAECYAVIGEVVARVAGFRPHATQLVAMILLGLQDEHTGSTGDTGYYQEVATGEGKTLIAATHAIFTALQGKQIAIATFNFELAQSAALDYRMLFDHFRLSSGAFSIFKNESFSALSADILYSTSQDLIFQYLYDRVEARAPLRGRRLDTLIVDEADALLFDLRRETCRVSCPSTSKVPPDFWQAWISYVDAIIEDPERGARSILTNLRGAFSAFRLDYKDQFPLVTDLDPIEGAALMRSAVLSRMFRKGRDFVVRSVPVKGAQSDQDREDAVVVVDFKHTGRIRELTHWNHGMHQFVAVRHGLPARDLSGTLGQLAHADFARLFTRVACLSGSWGSAVERAALRDRLRVDGFSVPGHRPAQRSDDPFSHVASTVAEHHSAILSRVSQIQNETPDRPILIVCESIEESQRVHALIRNRFPSQLLNDEDNLDITGVRRSERELIQYAGLPGRISVTQKMAGRGTDIRLSAPALRAGGLFVLQGYLPVDDRDLKQVWGRAARQGQAGSAATYGCLETDSFFRSLPVTAQQVIRAEYLHNPVPHREAEVLLRAARAGQSVIEYAKSQVYEAGDPLLTEIQTRFFALQEERRARAPEAVRELLDLQDELGFSFGLTIRSERLEAWWVNRFRTFDCHVRNSELLPLLGEPEHPQPSAEIEQLLARVSDATQERVSLTHVREETRLQGQLRIMAEAFAARLQELALERAQFECRGLKSELAQFRTELDAAASQM